MKLYRRKPIGCGSRVYRDGCCPTIKGRYQAHSTRCWRDEFLKGTADLPDTFSRRRDLDFNGVMTLQAYKEDEGVAVFCEQIELVRNLWNA